jgi:hypothetical protein
MKMLRLNFMLLAAVIVSSMILTGCKSKSGGETKEEAATEAGAESAGINQLTQAEKDDGWVLLFDGKSYDGWRGYGLESFPDSGWTIENGSLKCLHSGTGEAGAGGDVLYDKQFTNFHLKLEWMIEEGGNSGIFYLGQELADEGKKIWYTAPEYQILDNFSDHIDTKLGTDGNRLAGTLYDLVPADTLVFKGPMEWNSTEIMVYEGTVAHFMNGENLLEYHLWTDEWNKKIANSKFPSFNPDFAKVAKTGYICLQDHGHAVWFRNIKLKEF